MTSNGTMELRAERAPFVMLPRWLLYHPQVGEGAKFLYCVLHDLVAGREGPTRPVTRAQLADSCGVSVDTIDRRLTQLGAAGAVEKQAQIEAGGQVANVYQVWLTPPDGIRRTLLAVPTQSDRSGGGAPQEPIPPLPGKPGSPVENRGRVFAAPVEGCANPQVNRSRKSAAPPSDSQPGPYACGAPGRKFAAPSVFEEQEEEVPPQPPRAAGGPTLRTTTTTKVPAEPG